MKEIRIALDWTPNVNHIGFFAAKELGYYENEHLDLKISNPIDDNYQKTPGKKLEEGLVDFAIAPSETIISLNNKTNRVNAIGVFALLQEDLSSIASLASSGFKSPRELDGKVYASYKARYEDQIVMRMLVNDGGKGNLEIIYPDKLGIWNTLLDGKADATWIFDNWEGVEAAGKGIELNKYRMHDFAIPYGYSPVLITTKESIIANSPVFKKFISATKKGYLFVKNNPALAAEILRKYVTDYDRENIDLMASCTASMKYFGDQTTCGRFDFKRVDSFLNWLVEYHLEGKVILEQQLFTNELID